MPDGEFTGQWVYRKVSGKYRRTEYYRVGEMVNSLQYTVYLEGLKEYPCTWGKDAVRTSLTTVALCASCDEKLCGKNDYLCYSCRSAA